MAPLETLTHSNDTPASMRAMELQIEALRKELAELSARMPENRACMLVLSGDMERVMTALMLAHAAAAMGMKVSLYFAFWGVVALRQQRIGDGKTPVERGLGAVLPKDVGGLPSSKFNFGGLGPLMFKSIMAEKGIQSPAELLASAKASEIELVACPTSMDMFGLRAEELMPDLSFAGAASFLELAGRGKFSAIF